MQISREDVLRVAELAHLELSPDEVELYRGQLDEILSYIGKLQELDVSHVGPMTIAGDLAAAHLETPEPVGSQSDGSASSEPNLRDDIIAPCNIGEQVLAHAPDAVKPFFRVPKVIER